MGEGGLDWIWLFDGGFFGGGRGGDGGVGGM